MNRARITPRGQSIRTGTIENPRGLGMPRRPRSVFVSKPGRNACCGGISLSGERRPVDRPPEMDRRHRGQGPGHLRNRAREPPTQPPHRTTNPQVAGRFRRSIPIAEEHQAAPRSRYRTAVEAEAAKQQLVDVAIAPPFGLRFGSLCPLRSHPPSPGSRR